MHKKHETILKLYIYYVPLIVHEHDIKGTSILLFENRMPHTISLGLDKGKLHSNLFQTRKLLVLWKDNLNWFKIVELKHFYIRKNNQIVSIFFKYYFIEQSFPMGASFRSAMNVRANQGHRTEHIANDIFFSYKMPLYCCKWPFILTRIILCTIR